MRGQIYVVTGRLCWQFKAQQLLSAVLGDEQVSILYPITLESWPERPVKVSWAFFQVSLCPFHIILLHGCLPNLDPLFLDLRHLCGSWGSLMLGSQLCLDLQISTP